jgi:hypothetical protein
MEKQNAVKRAAPWLLLALALLTLACLSLPLPGLRPQTAIPPTSTPLPATPTLPAPPDAVVTPTAPPAQGGMLPPPRLFQMVILTAEPYSESGDGPIYTLEVNTPVLEGLDDPRVQEFNRQAALLVQALVDEFKAGFEYLPPEPVSAGSFYQVTFTQLAPPGDILSLQFAVDGYVDGAAHPYHLTRTLNFDLENGQALTLEALFLPGSGYLERLAAYCKAELATRDIGFDEWFAAGADPLPENYRNWNVTYQGLLITFDEYQVAPYAAGMQQVLVPYDALQDLLDPNGPISRIGPR